MKWEMKKLGDVTKIIYGYTEKASVEVIGPKFLRITDIQEDGVQWETVPFCKINLANLEKYKLKSGDIVFARTGATTGKSYLVHNPPEAVFASYLIKVHINNYKKLSPAYLHYFFQTPAYWESINSGISGSAQGGFNATKLAELVVPIPQLIEQQRIVNILDEAFAALDQAKDNLQRNVQNAKDLFQSELNQIFMQKDGNWQEKKLSQIALIFGRGKSKHRPRNDEKLYGGNYPFIQTGDVRNSTKYITDYTQTYSEIGLAQSKLWLKGTICITIAANIAETGILDFDSCFPDSMIGLVVDPKKANVEFTYYALQFLKSKLQALGKGSAQDNINMGTFEKQTFPFPPLKMQEQIAIRLDALSAETQQLKKVYEQKLLYIETLKKSLLQKAFSGGL